MRDEGFPGGLRCKFKQLRNDADLTYTPDYAPVAQAGLWSKRLLDYSERKDERIVMDDAEIQDSAGSLLLIRGLQIRSNAAGSLARDPCRA